MLKSKIIVLTLQSIDECPNELRHQWQGEIFFKHSKSGMILDTLNLTKLLKFKYMRTVEKQVCGDFCLMPLFVK